MRGAGSAAGSGRGFHLRGAGRPRIRGSSAGRLLAFAVACLSAWLPCAASGEDRAALEAVDRESRAAVLMLGSPDSDARDAASALLGRMGVASAPALCDALHHADPQIRFSAARLILDLKPVDFLLRRLASMKKPPYGLLRAFISRNAGRRGNETAAGEISARIGFFGGDGSIGFLLDMLQNGTDTECLHTGYAISLLKDDRGTAARMISCFAAAGTQAKQRLIDAMGGLCAENALAFLESAGVLGDQAMRSRASVSAAVVRKRLSAARRGGEILGTAEGADALPGPGDTSDGVFFLELVSRLAMAESPSEMGRALRFLRKLSVWHRVSPCFFGREGSERWIAPILRANETAGYGERLWILGVMSEHPENPEAAGFLAAALPDPAVGGAAATAAGDLCELISPHLGRKAREEGEPWRNLIASLLSRCGGHFSAVELGRIMTETGAPYAPGLLADMGPELALPQLVKGLNRPRSAQKCAEYIGKMGAEAGFDLIEKAIGMGLTSGELVEGLGRTGDSRAFAELIRRLEPGRRFGYALRGLVHLKDRRALPIFIRMLGDAEHAETAIDGLQAAGGEEARRVLGIFLDNYRFKPSRRDRRLFDRAVKAFESAGGR